MKFYAIDTNYVDYDIKTYMLYITGAIFLFNVAAYLIRCTLAENEHNIPYRDPIKVYHRAGKEL